MSICNVKDFNAFGDGVHDDAPAIQKALSSGAKEVVIPQGCYLLGSTLYVPSNTKITADFNARLIMDGAVRKKRGDFLLTNSGDCNIEIDGGVWDGNNTGEGNQKSENLFDPNAYSGTVLNFCGVRGLTLKNMVVANSVTYNIRMAKISDFNIENISFVSDVLGKNQDGLHFNGEVRHGRVKNIRALSKGQTNDDLIALNADDSMDRIENFGMVRGDIEDITFENLFAEDCLTVVRMLSVTSAIRNITIKNVYGGFKGYAVNCDSARYCATPLFKEEDYPEGVGCIENIYMENFTCYKSSNMYEDYNFPAICIESALSNFEIRNFNFIDRKMAKKPKEAIRFRNVSKQRVKADENEFSLSCKEDVLSLENFKNIRVCR